MVKIYRATTPTHTFLFPDTFAPSTFQKLRLTYAQGGKPVVEKTEADMTIDGARVSVTLTEEETGRFRVRAPQPVAQLRFLDNAGGSFASCLMPFAVEEVLNNEVLAE